MNTSLVSITHTHAYIKYKKCSLGHCLPRIGLSINYICPNKGRDMYTYTFLLLFTLTHLAIKNKIQIRLKFYFIH